MKSKAIHAAVGRCLLPWVISLALRMSFLPMIASSTTTTTTTTTTTSSAAMTSFSPSSISILGFLAISSSFHPSTSAADAADVADLLVEDSSAASTSTSTSSSSSSSSFTLESFDTADSLSFSSSSSSSSSSSPKDQNKDSKAYENSNSNSISNHDDRNDNDNENENDNDTRHYRSQDIKTRTLEEETTDERCQTTSHDDNDDNNDDADENDVKIISFSGLWMLHVRGIPSSLTIDDVEDLEVQIMNLYNCDDRNIDVNATAEGDNVTGDELPFIRLENVTVAIDVMMGKTTNNDATFSTIQKLQHQQQEPNLSPFGISTQGLDFVREFQIPILVSGITNLIEYQTAIDATDVPIFFFVSSTTDESSSSPSPSPSSSFGGRRRHMQEGQRVEKMNDSAMSNTKMGSLRRKLQMTLDPTSSPAPTPTPTTSPVQSLICSCTRPEKATFLTELNATSLFRNADGTLMEALDIIEFGQADDDEDCDMIIDEDMDGINDNLIEISSGVAISVIGNVLLATEENLQRFVQTFVHAYNQVNLLSGQYCDADGGYRHIISGIAFVDAESIVKVSPTDTDDDEDDTNNDDDNDGDDSTRKLSYYYGQKPLHQKQQQQQEQQEQEQDDEQQRRREPTIRILQNDDDTSRPTSSPSPTTDSPAASFTDVPSATTSIPTTSMGPTTSVNPTTSMGPTTSIHPTTSMNPSLSTDPTLSIHPTPEPSTRPSFRPTDSPTTSIQPSVMPTARLPDKFDILIQLQGVCHSTGKDCEEDGTNFFDDSVVSDEANGNDRRRNQERPKNNDFVPDWMQRNVPEQHHRSLAGTVTENCFCKIGSETGGATTDDILGAFRMEWDMLLEHSTSSSSSSLSEFVESSDDILSLREVKIFECAPELTTFVALASVEVLGNVSALVDEEVAAIEESFKISYNARAEAVCDPFLKNLVRVETIEVNLGSQSPSTMPSMSFLPSATPSTSVAPSSMPSTSVVPSSMPTTSTFPTISPSDHPSTTPSSILTNIPSAVADDISTLAPTAGESDTVQPTNTGGGSGRALRNNKKLDTIATATTRAKKLSSKLYTEGNKQRNELLRKLNENNNTDTGGENLNDENNNGTNATMVPTNGTMAGGNGTMTGNDTMTLPPLTFSPTEAPTMEVADLFFLVFQLTGVCNGCESDATIFDQLTTGTSSPPPPATGITRKLQDRPILQKVSYSSLSSTNKKRVANAKPPPRVLDEENDEDDDDEEMGKCTCEIDTEDRGVTEEEFFDTFSEDVESRELDSVENVRRTKQAKQSEKTSEPSISMMPSNQPSIPPTSGPSSSFVPTNNASSPSPGPSPASSEGPSPSPSEMPSTVPSGIPTAVPSSVPSTSPSMVPSTNPSEQPSVVPSNQPSFFPSEAPSSFPSEVPTEFPSEVPTEFPSEVPTEFPSEVPTEFPSEVPTKFPSSSPSSNPSQSPTEFPSESPSMFPSEVPSTFPSESPTEFPSPSPSTKPSLHPSTFPSPSPSQAPSTGPSASPSEIPSSTPTKSPTASPSTSPTSPPTPEPSPEPSAEPTPEPTPEPSPSPSAEPTSAPSSPPTPFPSPTPSHSPTMAPSSPPSPFPSADPTVHPSAGPTGTPSYSPSSQPTDTPSASPSMTPTKIPSALPTTTPSAPPTNGPTTFPTDIPSSSPSETPSGDPTLAPIRSTVATLRRDSSIAILPTLYGLDAQDFDDIGCSSSGPSGTTLTINVVIETGTNVLLIGSDTYNDFWFYFIVDGQRVGQGLCRSAHTGTSQELCGFNVPDLVRDKITRTSIVEVFIGDDNCKHSCADGVPFPSSGTGFSIPSDIDGLTALQPNGPNRILGEKYYKYTTSSDNFWANHVRCDGTKDTQVAILSSCDGIAEDTINCIDDGSTNIYKFDIDVKLGDDIYFLIRER